MNLAPVTRQGLSYLGHALRDTETAVAAILGGYVIEGVTGALRPARSTRGSRTLEDV